MTANKAIKKNEDYDGFVEKFKPKKTTDDCYTPPAVYEAVLSWVREEIGIPNNLEIARPFYPGGNYETVDYTGKVVIDNPPFSILSKIIKFYKARNIPFFLFAPRMTCLSGTTAGMPNLTAIFSAGDNGQIIYENGAVVPTAFVTNMAGDLKIWVSETLKEKIDGVNQVARKSLPKYIYPDEVFKAADSGLCAELKIDRADTLPINALECQRVHKKAIFGKGLLLTNKAAKAAKAANIIYWELSQREKAIIAEHETANDEEAGK